MRGRRVLGVVVALLLVVGVWQVARVGWQLSAVGRHERQWEQERPDDYSYRIELVCFCRGNLTWDVIVVDGRVVAVQPAVAPGDRPPTIEELFDVVRDAIRDGADDVDVSYSEVDGHPTRIRVDLISGGVDDEYEYLVTDFTEGVNA